MTEIWADVLYGIFCVVVLWLIVIRLRDYVNETEEYVMKLNAVLAGVLFMVFSIPAYGQTPDETWVCFERWDNAAEAEAVFEVSRYSLRHDMSAEGEVVMDGVRFPAQFHFLGLERRWYFESDRNHQVIIEPDGSGGYYDFSGIEQGETTRAKVGCRFERQ